MNINIDIPDEMRVYVEAQLMAGTYLQQHRRVFSRLDAARQKT
ncbi:hypothetical protein [Nostoc parmelioides]|nr:hypothetical protein [Nostoc parmelioides]